MKHIGYKLIFAFLLAAFFLTIIPLIAYAAESPDVVIGNNYTLNSGETLQDDLFILGGNVILMNNSTINGNVILLGGNLRAAGTIHGDVVVLGGSVDLASTLVLDGNLSTAGATVNRETGAQINGQVYDERNAPQIFTFPGRIGQTNFSNAAQPLLKVAGFFLGLFIWVLVAMIVAMFIPLYLERTSNTILSEPVISGGMGLLTVIVAPFVILLLAITICLIPVALLVVFVLVAAWAFGLIAIGFEVGKRINAIANQQWHPVISAGLGTLILMLVLNGVDTIIPCVGWIPKAIIGLFGLGSVLLTQFGRKPYPPLAIPPVQPASSELPPGSIVG